LGNNASVLFLNCLLPVVGCPLLEMKTSLGLIQSVGGLLFNYFQQIEEIPYGSLTAVYLLVINYYKIRKSTNDRQRTTDD